VRKWRTLLILLACAAAVLLYPAETVVVPAWRIRVVDETGRPWPNEFVRQHWRHYSLGGSGGAEDKWTDANGYVTFPDRTSGVSLLRKVLVPLRSAVALGPHASYGPSANVMVWGGRLVPEIAYYEPGKTLPDEIVLPRQGN